MAPYYTIAGFAFLAWALLAIAAMWTLPKPVEGVVAFLAACCAMVAGWAALYTPIRGWIQWTLQLNPWLSLVLMLAALALVVMTVAVLFKNRTEWTLPVMVAWVFLPSALAAGVVPGKVGRGLSSGVITFASWLAGQTQGWFT